MENMNAMIAPNAEGRIASQSIRSRNSWYAGKHLLLSLIQESNFSGSFEVSLP